MKDLQLIDDTFWRIAAPERCHSICSGPSALPPVHWFEMATAIRIARTIGWIFSCDVLAVLTVRLAASFGLWPLGVFRAMSLALVVSATVARWAGTRGDPLIGRGGLPLLSLVRAFGMLPLTATAYPLVQFVGWLIANITLIDGFSVTIGWPLSGPMVASCGRGEACLGWPLVNLHFVLFCVWRLTVPLPAGALKSTPRCMRP